MGTERAVFPEHRSVCVHYLGHASFVLRFAETIVITDYGEPNAWLEWDWDSPIHDVGDVMPDLVTYSHTHHADHFDAGRLTVTPKRILRDGASAVVGGVDTCAIPMHEQDLDAADTYAYLFTFEGLRVLHLGDCQADLAGMSSPEHRERLASLLPRHCDLVLVPIESQERHAAGAVDLLRLLQPRVAIPMHYWSEDALEEFLELARSDERSFSVERMGDAQLFIPSQPAHEGTVVPPMRRAPFRGWNDATRRASSTEAEETR